MTNVRIRVHETLGVLVEPKPREGWIWILASSGRVQPGRATDKFAEGPGWREIDLEERT